MELFIWYILLNLDHIVTQRGQVMETSTNGILSRLSLLG